MSNKLNKKTNNVRALAVQTLTKIEKQNSYSNLALNSVIESNNLSNRDAALLTNIVYGVIQHKLTLEYYLASFINLNKTDNWVKILLMTALYQELYLDKIPKRAIFNETIEVAKILGHAGIRKYVTGVLHAIDRQGLPEIPTDNLVKNLSLKSSTPTWLVDYLIKSVGEKKASSILSVINNVPNHSVRVNTQQIDIDKLSNQLIQEGYEVTQSNVSPVGLIMDGGFIPKSKAFKEGKLVIQDESAMLAVDSMNVQPNDTILDACAAPGGKTTQIADSLQDGEVYALDIHQHKVKLIAENASRQNVADRVKGIQLDARKVNDEFSAEYFDKILVDAPCSGLGLLRRKPEVKYDKNLNDSKNLHKIQVEILEKVAPTLKEGGVLTYSTCTIIDIENQQVVDEFLSKHPDFKQVKTKTMNKIKENRDELGLTIYPDDFNSDGFFIATLVKNN
ncbi:16s ribosomal rna m(5)c 967 methyltransferase [Ligilactobacillus hayakitensis DSM 18933 = JCM 14209]|uniref:16S rRNA (cytosine(967)-C(5))-methyltransferase n=1 Tax=Ligilactobacillus hayakitensis DSM 18933 = JCM 14209 TaxID=1423755 RepID=A0A0R1WX34_9LACO|nr:16S rRNA (cytosine(967)-C(5))-methyltransferase RsmB [Ligilactobacillus hayakitensis]KRM18860.1 16s ribosomal rna m(5)c 967 methyltransferase [Ligilactobacillus hayakitensis DSM 18933 = JCM 14209]